MGTYKRFNTIICSFITHGTVFICFKKHPDISKLTFGESMSKFLQNSQRLELQESVVQESRVFIFHRPLNSIMACSVWLLESEVITSASNTGFPKINGNFSRNFSKIDIKEFFWTFLADFNGAYSYSRIYKIGLKHKKKNWLPIKCN